MTHDDRSRRRAAGFTLLELLIGVVASTFILFAMAHGIGLVGEQAEALRAEADQGPQEAVALMTDMARYGWLVEQPADGRLDVVDSSGGRTTFALVDGDLVLTRPSGASGTLLHGVASFDVESDTARRLREAEPVDEFRTWFDRPAVGADSEDLRLETGLPVALGFTMPSEVPDTYDAVADVDEHAVVGTLLTLGFSASYVSSVPDDPNEPVSGGSGGKGGKGKGSKVEICHIPPGNPSNAHTLSVSASAVDAHLAHGDVLGPCGALPPPTQAAELLVLLYEARAPDDARPVGPVLASQVLVANAIPHGSASWVATEVVDPPEDDGTPTTQEEATTASGKVVMCHVPPGNPSNAHAITISPNAVPAHLAHGDYFGVCGEHDPAEELYTLQIDATPSPISLDLSGLGAVIEPGRAYTLVISMQSEGFILIGGESLGSPQNSGVAQASVYDGDVEAVAVSVPMSLDGMQRITQTVEHAPVSRVAVSVGMASGASASGSANITSQLSVAGLWDGVVAGETEALEQ